MFRRVVEHNLRPMLRGNYKFSCQNEGCEFKFAQQLDRENLCARNNSAGEFVCAQQLGPKTVRNESLRRADQLIMVAEKFGHLRGKQKLPSGKVLKFLASSSTPGAARREVLRRVKADGAGCNFARRCQKSCACPPATTHASL